MRGFNRPDNVDYWDKDAPWNQGEGDEEMTRPLYEIDLDVCNEKIEALELKVIWFKNNFDAMKEALETVVWLTPNKYIGRNGQYRKVIIELLAKLAAEMGEGEAPDET